MPSRRAGSRESSTFRVAVRYADRILLLDRDDQIAKTIFIPAEIRSEAFKIHDTTGSEVVLERDTGRATDIYWVSTEGKRCAS